MIAEIARAAYPVLPIRSLLGRVASVAQRAVGAVEEVGVSDVRLRIRAGLDAGNWRVRGERLLRGCAEHDKRVLLVIDELPIFLKRMLRAQDGMARVDGFLSWLRGVLQGVGAGAVYDALGIGIPHHVQSFFARLRDFAVMENRDRVTVADVERVYRTGLLGPSGQNDLAHYETRLRDGLDDDSRSIAMEILAEAATQEVFTAAARPRLGELYSRVVDDSHARITEVLDVLVHDGYLEARDGDHRFPSRLLRDWWAARFRDHHVPVADRSPDAAEGPVR